MGERRTRMGKKRHYHGQLDEVIMSIYANKRVLKKSKAEHCPGHGGSNGFISSSGPELDGDLETAA